jgi:hypothetical protein
MRKEDILALWRYLYSKEDYERLKKMWEDAFQAEEERKRNHEGRQ